MSIYRIFVVEDIGSVNQDRQGYVAVTRLKLPWLQTINDFSHFMPNVGCLGDPVHHSLSVTQSDGGRIISVHTPTATMAWEERTEKLHSSSYRLLCGQ